MASFLSSVRRSIYGRKKRRGGKKRRRSRGCKPERLALCMPGKGGKPRNCRWKNKRKKK